MKKLPIVLNIPARVVVALGLIVLVAEYLIMVIIHVAAARLNIPHGYLDFIDPILLTLIISPALYLLVFRKMHESEERFRQINASVLDAIIVINEQCLITEWNLAAQQMFQYKRDEAVGRQLHQLLAPPRYHADAARGFSRFQETGTGPLIGKTTELTAVRQDGSEFPIELSISAAKVKGRWHAMGVMRDITERKQIEEKIRNLAFHDTLTQLPNRRLLSDRLGQTMAASKRSGRHGALMFLDLDNFKPLNDVHGHDAGDLLLVEVARRITGCIRQVDTVARFGGDEFVVMLSELDEDKDLSVTQAGIVAEKIRATLAEPYVLTIQREGGAETTVEHRCTASIGVVLFINHEASPEDIIKWADMTMYQAKEGGRNQVRFYE